jgi:phosphoglycolate phosphatase-like HAD superfamily hydrolase
MNASPSRSAPRRFSASLALLFVLTIASMARAQEALDPLPSWNEGAAKKAIVDFVTRVTAANGPDFIAPVDRIAVFDNDGTLWCEQPMYVEARFILDRVVLLAPSKPEWKTTEPFRSVLAGDQEGIRKAGKRGILELVMATHADVTTDEFEQAVKEFLLASRHPRFSRPYTELAYRPMLEVLAYLRANDFKTFIVSGGEIEFMRPFAHKVYGVPSEQIVGSSIKTKFIFQGDKPAIMRLPEAEFLDDGPGKPVAIQKFIGRRPLIAFGNSDGDLEMLQWTTLSPGPRLGLIVHHDDAKREYAYDRDSHIGRLDKALDEAQQRGWQVISMKNDWKEVFPSDEE